MYPRSQYLNQLISKKDNGRIKIITGLRNGDLDKAITSLAENCSKPQSEALRGAVRNALKKSKFVPHIGVQHGRIYNAGPTSSAMGYLKKMLAS